MSDPVDILGEWTMRRGDRLPLLALAVEDDHGEPVDITGTTAYLLLRHEDGLPAISTGNPSSRTVAGATALPAYVYDGPNGIVIYDWPDEQTENLTVGVMDLQVLVQWPGISYAATHLAPSIGTVSTPDVAQDPAGALRYLADPADAATYNRVVGPSRIVGVNPAGTVYFGSIRSAQMEAINRAQLVFPGVVGNYLSVPDAANLDITDDIEIVVRCAPTIGSSQQLVSKYLTTGGQRSYSLQLRADGGVTFNLSSTGGSADIGTGFGPAGMFVTSGVMQWVKATRQRSTGIIRLYTAPDSPTEPTTWTQRGADTTGTMAAIFVSTSPVAIGQHPGGTEFYTGRIARAIVRNGIAGTTVLDVSENNAGTMATATTFVATSGQTVTVNSTGNAAHLNPQIGTVTTPDFGTLPNNFTVVWSVRNMDATAGGYPAYAGQNEGSDPRSYWVYRTTSNGRVVLESTSNGVWANRVIGYSTARPMVVDVDETMAVAITNDNGSGRRIMSSYVRESGTWTPLELNRDAAVGGQPFDVATAVRVGLGAIGRIYSVECRTGPDPAAGTVLWRFDAAEYPGTGTSFVDPRGRTWTLTAAGAIIPAVAPIVQPQADAVVWRFDASEYPGTGLSYVDPRGRTWTLSTAGAIVPTVEAVPGWSLTSPTDRDARLVVRPSLTSQQESLLQLTTTVTTTGVANPLPGPTRRRAFTKT